MNNYKKSYSPGDLEGPGNSPYRQEWNMGGLEGPQEPKVSEGPENSFSWKLDETFCLRIYGKGNMPSWSDAHQVPWYGIRDKIRFAVVNSGITDVGDCAFQGCKTLTGVILANSITRIGSQAFEDCTSLAEVILPGNVISIGRETFRSCTALTRISISEGVTSIGTSAFSHCSSLTSVTLPKSLEYVGPDLFKKCRNLTRVTMPSSFNKWIYAVEMVAGNAVATTFKDIFGIRRNKVTFI